MSKKSDTAITPCSVDIMQPDETVETALVAPARSYSREVALLDGSGLGQASPTDLANRLKIVYDVSKDKPDTVPASSWSLGQNYRFVFADGAKPMPVLGYVVATSNTYFKEWKDYVAGGAAPKTYHSRNAALEDGQRVDWGVKGSNTEKPTVSPAIDVYILVERPSYISSHSAEDADAMFSWYLDGKPYALAVFTADRGAYKFVAASLTELRNQDALMRKVPLVQGALTTWKLSFSIASRKSVTGRTQKYCVVSAAMQDGNRVKASDTFIQDLKDVLGSFSAPAAAVDSMEF